MLQDMVKAYRHASGHGQSLQASCKRCAEPTIVLQEIVKASRGRFGTVKLCTEKSTGRLLAVKIVPYTEETKESTLLEYHILKKLHHTNVVQLHAAFLSPQDLALILELCEGRELLRCLSTGPQYCHLLINETCIVFIRGRFGTVKLCTEKSTGRLLAVKIVPYTEETKESTLLEYHILKKLHHTNVVQLHAAFLSPQDLALILELCEGRELLRCLSTGQSYSELEVRDYLWQILSAVEFLHGKQILHLDLRSENTVVTEHKLLKILDFGNAQLYCPDKVTSPQRYTDYVETMAPELLEGQGAIPPTDIWAVGVTAFVMLSADYPFSPDCGPELEKEIKKGLIKFSHCYAGLSGGAVRFLQSALWSNPWGRPSASDCLKMPWLQEAGLATLQQLPVYFPSAKLRSFLRQRAAKTKAAGSSRS
ncbi:PREDICTED: obscurin-like [Nanorana parkeri]|uniref:obscurin-like n=1 Tax=Nanorana parkeri TaxID=125878 RepID=UPI0008546BC2|nr:PREDICTED: obscurin-like [Nanorana parkeri]